MSKSLAVAVACIVFSGCSTMRHTVGTGGGGQQVAQQTQWQLLAGLIPINTVNGGKLAADAGAKSDFTIQSQQSVLDALVSIVTSGVIHPFTVTVTK